MNVCGAGMLRGVVFVTKLCIGNGKVTLTSLNYLISVIVSSSVLRNFVKFYCV